MRMAGMQPPSTRPCAVCAQPFTSQGFAKNQWKKGAAAKCLACAKASAEENGETTRPELEAARPELKAATNTLRLEPRGLLGEVRALVTPSAGIRSPPAGKRTSLEKHHSTFMGHGQAWLLELDTYVKAVSGDRRALALLEQMATSTSKGPGGRGEACFAKYLCGKVFKCSQATNILKIRTDNEKVTRYWTAAAKTGLSYALCGLGNMAREGALPGQAGEDFSLARALWVHAWTECDLPEAAYNLGVFAGFGYGGPQDYGMALVWYRECIACDLGGRGRAGDAPVGARHGSLQQLLEVGPNNDSQATFPATAAKNARVVGKKMLERGDTEDERAMLRDLFIAATAIDDNPVEYKGVPRT